MAWPDTPLASWATRQPSTSDLLGSGRTADVYLWGEDRVLKLFHPWCSAAWVEHEIEIARLIEQAGLPAPKLLEIVTVADRPGIVYERIRGSSMLSACRSRPWHALRFARQLAELHVSLHRRSGDGLPSAKAALGGAIERARDVTDALKRCLLSRLDGLPDGSALCHFDLHPGQVILAADGPVILDWMTALRGDPAADVARTVMLFRVGRLRYAGALTHAAMAVWRPSFLRAYLDHYLALNPAVTRAQVRAWMAPIAAARLREEVAGEREGLLALIAGAEKPS